MVEQQFQGFAQETQNVNQSESGVGSFFKKLVKGVLIIGGIIFLIPVVLVLICFAILILGSAFAVLPLVSTLGSATMLVTVVSKDKGDKRSRKYFPLLVFLGIFLLLLVAGQYDVQSFNCPLHFDYVSNLFVPLTPLMASLAVFKISKK
jgi:hypothetical protein